MPDFVLRGSLLALLLLVLGSGPASAHASLVGTDPADGTTLATSPRAITLHFNENIGSPAFVAVRAPDGGRVTTSRVRAVDGDVTAVVAESAERGTYTASYRVVSADGHPVSGSIQYEVTTGTAVKQVKVPVREGFVHRHSAHFFWGILAAAVAVGLLLAPLRRRSDSHDT